jgi:hypothetical protein
MKLICLALLLCFSISLFSQQTTPTVNTDYLKKSKNQKTTAGILLGGGTAFVLIGLALFPKNYSLFGGNSSSTESQAGVSAVMILAGGGSMLASIPFFIASSKNKKKAMSMSLKNQLVPVLQGDGFANRVIPSLIVKINL